MDRFIEDCAALENVKLKMQKRFESRDVEKIPPRMSLVETMNFAFLTGAATWARYLRDGKSVDDFIKKYASEAKS